MTHPADADYSAHHTLSDDQLDDMLDAAIDTANAVSAALSGRRWRRLRPIEGAFPPPAQRFGELNETDWTTMPPPKEGMTYIGQVPAMVDFMQTGADLRPHGDPREAASWHGGTYQVAKDAAMIEPVKLPATDVALIRDLIAVTESRIERLRETSASAHPIIDKALTSMALGLLGLVKAVDDDGRDDSVASG